MSEKINNAVTTLDWDLSSSWMLFIVKTWEWDLFDTVDYPYKLTIEQYQGILIKKREVLTISGRTGDAFTVSERASETCVQDETVSPKVRTQNALSFLSWDTVRMTITEEDWNDTQEEIFTNIPADLDLKLNITDFQNQTAIYGSSSTWTDAYAITLSPVPSALADLKWAIFFLADVWNTWPATLNINWLWAKTIKKKHDQDLETWDIEVSQKVQVVYNPVSDVFEMVSQEASIVNVQVEKLEKDLVNVSWEYIPPLSWLRFWNDTIIRVSNILQATWWGAGDLRYVWYSTTYYELWQWITYSWNILKNIVLDLKKIWSPNFVLNVEVFSGAFWGLLWTSTNSINAIDLTTWYLSYQFDFDDLVVPWTFYFKINIVSWTPSTSNYVHLDNYIASSIYAWWTAYKLTSAWWVTAESTSDLKFEINKTYTTEYEDTNKLYVSKNETNKKDILWITVDEILLWEAPKMIFNWIVDWFTWLTQNWKVYLQADWTINNTISDILLWYAYITTWIILELPKRIHSFVATKYMGDATWVTTYTHNAWFIPRLIKVSWFENWGSSEDLSNITFWSYSNGSNRRIQYTYAWWWLDNTTAIYLSNWVWWTVWAQSWVIQNITKNTFDVSYTKSWAATTYWSLIFELFE